jgi:hypothetical protein
MSREPGATGLIVRLKNLPHLRKLELRHTSVTDAGLAHLKEVKTLEFLRLPEQHITDEGFRCMAELTELRELYVPRPHYVNPKMNKDYYTDEGDRLGKRGIRHGLLSARRRGLPGYAGDSERRSR